MNSENFSLQGILSLWDCNQMKMRYEAGMGEKRPYCVIPLYLVKRQKPLIKLWWLIKNHGNNICNKNQKFDKLHLEKFDNKKTYG